MKTVKLMIPVTLTLVEKEKNKSSSDTYPSNLWVRSFPHCKHEREKITESWQVLEILPMVITNHIDQVVTAHHCSNENISEQFVLVPDSVFSVIHGQETEAVDYDYFVEKYKEHDAWLIVYCRKCSTIYHACGL